METLASTGVRISELQYVTVQTLRTGRVWAEGKGKAGWSSLTPKAVPGAGQVLPAAGNHRWAGVRHPDRAAHGPVQHLAEMRTISVRRLGVEARRVFPHNFRHLFARAFYALEKDIAKLADLLGHASVETTRIYIMESGAEHKRQVERLGLVL